MFSDYMIMKTIDIMFKQTGGMVGSTRFPNQRTNLCCSALIICRDLKLEYFVPLCYQFLSLIALN